jgi:hypothetical protein
MLKSIVDLIGQSDTPIEIVKVKSHTGIVGNEVADEAAVEVATTAHTTENKDWEHNLPESNDRHNTYWPHMTDSQGDEGSSPIQDLGPHLKKEVRKKHGMGQCNTDTIYYNAWKQKETEMDPKYSYAFLKDKHTTFRERKHTMQYRTGTLYCMKMAQRFGHTNTDLCQHCNMRDGTHHAVGECKNTQLVRMERHNKAGRIIMRAVAVGRQGTNLVMAADVGNTDKLEDMGIEAVARTIPSEVWGPRPPDTKPTSRPDILLFRPPEDTEGQGYIDLIEIKYGRDTDLSTTAHRAELQHDELYTALQNSWEGSCTIRKTHITLGVGGAIYKTTVQSLQETLGIEGKLLTTTCKHLHRNAVRYLSNITANRRREMKQTKKDTRKGVT